METIRSYLSLVYIEIAAAANAMDQVEAEQHAAADAAIDLRLDRVLEWRAPSRGYCPERRPHTPRPPSMNRRNTEAPNVEEPAAQMDSALPQVQVAGPPVPTLAAAAPRRNVDGHWVPSSRLGKGRGGMLTAASAIPQVPVPRVPAAATVPAPSPMPWPMVQV